MVNVQGIVAVDTSKDQSRVTLSSAGLLKEIGKKYSKEVVGMRTGNIFCIRRILTQGAKEGRIVIYEERREESGGRLG